MIRSRLFRAYTACLAGVASVAGFYGLVLDDPLGGALMGVLVVLAAVEVWRAVQASEAREERLQHALDHASERNLADTRQQWVEDAMDETGRRLTVVRNAVLDDRTRDELARRRAVRELAEDRWVPVPRPDETGDAS